MLTSEISDSASAIHENHRIRRPASRSTTGASTSTPPRMTSMTNGRLTPSNVYASVVVTRIVAVASPDRNVQRFGLGHRRPAGRA